MNTYEIRITNVDDHSDFHTEEKEASSLGAVVDIIQEAYTSVANIEFRYNNKYIVIFEASDEGYMYDIYRYKEDYEAGKESRDGSQCTSTLSNAIEMALSQA